MLLDVTCWTGSIPSELGKLRALQGLDLSSNQLTGEPNVCLGVSGTFVVSDGAYVSNGIYDVEKYIFFFVRCSSNVSIPSKTTILGTLEIFSLHFSGNKSRRTRYPNEVWSKARLGATCVVRFEQARCVGPCDKVALNYAS